MEWKKIIIQSAITLLIGVGGVLVAIGAFAHTVETTEKAIERIANEQLPALAERIGSCEMNLAASKEADEANNAAHAAILRELDLIQKQLQLMQSTIHQHPK